MQVIAHADYDYTHALVLDQHSGITLGRGLKE